MEHIKLFNLATCQWKTVITTFKAKQETCIKKKKHTINMACPLYVKIKWYRLDMDPLKKWYLVKIQRYLKNSNFTLVKRKRKGQTIERCVDAIFFLLWFESWTLYIYYALFILTELSRWGLQFSYIHSESTVFFLKMKI